MTDKISCKEPLYLVKTESGIKVVIPEYAKNIGDEKEFLLGYQVFNYDKMFEYAFEHFAFDMMEVYENGEKT